ncbi:MAG: permease [Actinomycetota bacterium]
MDTFIETLVLVVEVGALFLGVTVAVQLFQARFGAERLRTWMGGRPVTAALKGIALGFATPFCTFTAIPMVVGLRQARVPAAGYVAFIVAAPVLDPVLMGALVLIAGYQVALIYAAVAFVAALTLALVAHAFDVERHLPPIESFVGATAGGPAAAGAGTGLGATGQGDGDGPACGQTVTDAWGGLRNELPPAFRRATALLRGMAPILLIGIGLSVLIEAMVPPSVTERLTSASPALSVPIAAAVGTPLYVSTTVFVPIAESLGAAGVGIGAIVALTIAGAGANLPEFVILSKLARPHVIGTFVGYVFVVAVIGGLLTQTLIG